jgi:DUF971 family protein
VRHTHTHTQTHTEHFSVIKKNEKNVICRKIDESGDYSVKRNTEK